MYDPDRTYLDVDFTGTPGYANGFNQFAKDVELASTGTSACFTSPRTSVPWLLSASSQLSLMPGTYLSKLTSTSTVNAWLRRCAKSMIIVGSSVLSA
jgi:hypothetical protein